MDVHQRRKAGNNQRPAEEQPPVRNVEQENESAISRMAKEISDCISKFIYDVTLQLLTETQCFLRKFLVKKTVLTVICFLCIFIAKSTLLSYVCSSFIGGLPHISELCSPMSEINGQNSTRIVIPVHSFIEKNVQLAECISETNVDTTGKLAEAKMALFDLTTLISFSQLESSAKDELMTKIDETTNLAQLTSRGIHKMLAKFNSALEELESYAKSLYKHLANQKFIVSRWTSKVGELEITRQFFENELETLESEIEHVSNDTEKVNSMLENLGENFRQLNIIASKSHGINSAELTKIDNVNFITRLYRNILGEGNIHKNKHQRNLQVLNQLTNITKVAANQTIRVLDILGQFQTEVDWMKKTVSKMDRAQTLPVGIHLETLSNAIEKLHTYYLRFVQRRNEVNQIN